MSDPTPRPLAFDAATGRGFYALQHFADGSTAARASWTAPWRALRGGGRSTAGGFARQQNRLTGLAGRRRGRNP